MDKEEYTCKNCGEVIDEEREYCDFCLREMKRESYFKNKMDSVGLALGYYQNLVNPN